MKKLFLSFIIVAFFSCVAQAQDVPASADKRINLLTRVMATELQLNEAEFIKLRSLNRERILKSDEIAVLYGSDAAVVATKLKEVEDNFDKQFTAILNPVQQAAYTNYKQTTEETKLTAAQVEKVDKANAALKDKKLK
ncbi:hypothetical protein [Adhaeribacter pallidiroseus]|uniref:Peptidylprolyl isomerase n=1 Tax=Adhaeribacter pallidiroseus TaxID=2072847 RepID=A0A369QDM5_9BACT|nr:hypothetical protein [Adhaeribacter pallidiroseus]RDC62814.1 hypothetical protein AHMF7616_01408 [Adhaeribacter pallidiroseus]